MGTFIFCSTCCVILFSHTAYFGFFWTCGRAGLRMRMCIDCGAKLHLFQIFCLGFDNAVSGDVGSDLF